MQRTDELGLAEALFSHFPSLCGSGLELTKEEAEIRHEKVTLVSRSPMGTFMVREMRAS